MDLCSALASPRLCQLDGETYWVRPLRLADYALILAWLDDVLPGKTERTTPPLLGSDESQDALSSANGWELLVWLGLRADGATWNEAAALAREATDVERIRFHDALFTRRRTKQPRPGGEDLAEAWCGPMMTAMCERFGMTLEDIAALTLDQVECLNSDGLESEDPRRVSHEELARFDVLAKANREAKERQPDQPSGFEVAIDEAVARFEAAKAAEVKTNEPRSCS